MCTVLAQLQCGTDLAGRNYSNTNQVMKQQDETCVARSVYRPKESSKYSGTSNMQPSKEYIGGTALQLILGSELLQVRIKAGEDHKKEKKEQVEATDPVPLYSKLHPILDTRISSVCWFVRP